ncbi:MAG: hypothetical protein A3I05_01390 [Deltaproteobacteria bacterium RIFCSPLOWO2_02_FULL_44_10]|nr:MAG: hypothetical protein A3C46_00665 [Deltaproteobacteria bacterium RIFCSPHIGHO2_02_FULL_44_16]OGQ46966.1 MAG: hypothetical protein A3I05_01390 [Deltaproteobacteria bacterium RIFCSPLOWO2_02_FULL_44_10]
MEKYNIELTYSAEKALFQLSKEPIQKIMAAIQSLTENPYPVGCRKLSGEDGIYRIRVGTYRIIYSIHKKEILIKILKVGHRKEIYR